ncbi:hypothetical protein B566_EDAN007388 [Ephemera danica]|nr:hypothetical protein B566_EDAN007388 [Ephemera danica]
MVVTRDAVLRTVETAGAVGVTRHAPACSPQKCTLRNGQSSKLELTTSRGRSNSRVEVVPMGEVMRIRRLPRGKKRSVSLHCTCSKWRTSLYVSRHPSTSICTCSV